MSNILLNEYLGLNFWRKAWKVKMKPFSILQEVKILFFTKVRTKVEMKKFFPLLLLLEAEKKIDFLCKINKSK